MNDLPLVIDLIDDGAEFKRLMQKLLKHDGQLNGYEFEQGPEYVGEHIHGVVKENYSDLKCPTAFYFLWIKKPITQITDFVEVKKSFDSLLKSDIVYRSYVLVIPHDFAKEEKELLDVFLKNYSKKIKIHHYGQTVIQELLDKYSALKKYFYSRAGFAETSSQDFVTINEKYRQRIRKARNHLHFVGISTGNYQKQQRLLKTELAKVYISLEFSKNRNGDRNIKLSDIMSKSNRVVVLGNPGSGKTTLANYLALIHCQSGRMADKVKKTNKTPFIIPVRNLEKMPKEKCQSYDFIGYLKSAAKESYGFCDLDKDFFIAMLELGYAIVVFDGLDEITSEKDRCRIAECIGQFSSLYPDSIIWITARIVGYTENTAKILSHFDLYYLTDVSERQARAFIKNWYKIQVPDDNSLRVERIYSLNQAIKGNPGVKRLRANPLLLTMMTLVHQFEGTLPDNRARLYEKCVELLLKTWQDHKYNSMGIKNPLDKRGLKYDTQLRLLAAIAFYIQEKAAKSTGNKPTLIEEKELRKLLFEQRFDKRRMIEKKAWEDVRVFIDYIRERTGLLVEMGFNKDGEKLFSFIHITFREYLTAYYLAEDRSKSHEEQIQQLLQWIEMPICWEPVLLALHLFSRAIDFKFIDTFTEVAFKKLTNGDNPIGWLLMGRAVRDNINFISENIKKIIIEVVNIWLEGKENGLAYTILKEIIFFSDAGKKNLKKMLKETIENNPAHQAFKALCFYKIFYRIDSSIPGIILKNNNHHILWSYLPVCRNNKHFSHYIREKLDEQQWFVYYFSAPDKTLENLDNLLMGEVNHAELKGYLLSSWRHLFKRFRDRMQFLEEHKDEFDNCGHEYTILCDFAGHTGIHSPLTLFQPYSDIMVNLAETQMITEKQFIEEDWKNNILPGDRFLKLWIKKIVEKTLEEFAYHPLQQHPHVQDHEKHLASVMKHLRIDNFRVKSQDYIREFLKNLLKGSGRDFLQRFTPLLSRYLTGTGKLIQDVLVSFNREFFKNINPAIPRKFSRTLVKYIDSVFLHDFINKFLIEHLSDINQSLKDRISRLYRKNYNRKLTWEDLSQVDYERISGLYLNEFSRGNTAFIDAFFSQLHKYLFYDKLKISIESINNARDSRFTSLMEPVFLLFSPLKPDSVMIPFIFSFWLAAALNHYLIHILADWFTRFYKNDELNEDMISGAIDDYCARHPFIQYLIHFGWDFYAADFNKMHQEKENKKGDNLPISVILTNAAKISSTIGIPLRGEHWEKFLEKAEQIGRSDLLVNISLTLYKLCNFQDRKKNSILLKELLERLKQNSPTDYKLLGVTL